MNLCVAMHQGDPRAAAPQFQSCDGRRILAADNQHIGRKVGVGIEVVVMHLAQALAGNMQVVGPIVIAGGDCQFVGLKRPCAAKRSTDAR